MIGDGPQSLTAWLPEDLTNRLDGTGPRAEQEKAQSCRRPASSLVSLKGNFDPAVVIFVSLWPR